MKSFKSLLFGIIFLLILNLHCGTKRATLLNVTSHDTITVYEKISHNKYGLPILKIN